MMRNDIPLLLKSFIAFLHPVIMTAVVTATFYAAYFGVQTRRTRTARSEEKKELVKKKFNLKHAQVASILLSMWVVGGVGGMAVTYYLYGQLFFSPHLIVGLSVICFAALAGSLSTFIYQGKSWARVPHIAFGVLIAILSIAQVVTGVSILIQDMLPEMFGK
ncbi:MAG: DUF4079 domain-containing protein [Microcoleus sp. PH2017_29_MFU_D_A]|uniref:DUF4079 domain-containing protein n=1 Tax=unclassified Microcoleus TaxID=2642155 RepID=UPI001D89037A|nr:MULTISPECIES: DUF4079 domain-containing protein [unclassified Microcoleus]MCC3507512.1 DUF4079 domain-containing protein [Microcoleus sp. PH2017_19_SFW_U_A]MCC3526429.1 DUF4079 domain-containing protein [Microcoleus sp. PH2017_20_SFW_D_A]TAE16531.1 MAG: DUF4079 domain-containing protein [Oscillatoriales cyanobacterium]MCC3410704.1 DUF4079 domain-containing protein [Microcoleus sp. PH2017_02_FOX_O_A]MCC3514894.1 DUF4079 domain-containing protein [Microcoleus sp. PH2017_18_LLB_O_A]